MDSQGDGEADRTVAETLQKWMSHKNLTVMALHKRTGISRETFYRTLGGKTGISLDRLRQIAAELGTTAGAIIDGVAPPAGPESGTLDRPQGLVGRVAALEERQLEAAQLFDQLLARLEEHGIDLSGFRMPPEA